MHQERNAQVVTSRAARFSNICHITQPLGKIFPLVKRRHFVIWNQDRMMVDQVFVIFVLARDLVAINSF